MSSSDLLKRDVRLRVISPQFNAKCKSHRASFKETLITCCGRRTEQRIRYMTSSLEKTELPLRLHSQPAGLLCQGQSPNRKRGDPQIWNKDF